MSNLPVFGCEETKKALKDLGFTIDESKGKGGHAKATHPTRKSTNGQAPYVIIRGLKEYGDAFFRSHLINEIRCFGFTRDEVIKAINDHR